MSSAPDWRRWLNCWGVSLALHAILVILVIDWLIHPARFHVAVGQTSMEIDLVRAPVPVPAATPPEPAVPPLAPALPTPAPALLKPEIVTKVDPLPPTPSLALIQHETTAKPHPATPKTMPGKVASSAAKGAVDAQPEDLLNLPPEYPEDSRAAREQGVVLLQVEVTAAGEPAAVIILKSSGYFRLDQAARRAVLHWKFYPAIAAGVPVTSEAEVPVRFKLQ